jgi:hypothetical protein
MKNEKKITLIIVSVLMAVLMVMVSAIYASAASPLLKASVSKYEPAPVEPGSYATVYIKIENTGDGNANNATVEIVPEFPFSLDPNENAVKSIGILGSQKDYSIDFKIRVSENAVPGTNTLKIRYTDDPLHGNWQEQTFDIQVQIHDAIIAITSAATTPEQIAPGGSAELRIQLRNLASSYIKNVKLKLNLEPVTETSSLTSTTTVISDLPFAPVDSSTEKIVERIDPDQTADVVFKIKAYPDAASKLYKVPITISYSDALGNSYTKEDLVGILVNSEPELIVTVDSTTLYGSQKTGNVVLQFTNKGIGDVKFLTVTLQESAQYDILSPSNIVYLGNINSDDFDTAEFKIFLKNGDNLDLPFKIDYRDANDNQYEKTGVAKLTIQSAEKLGVKTSNTGVYIAIVAAVLIVGFFILRRRKKKSS